MVTGGFTQLLELRLSVFGKTTTQGWSPEFWHRSVLLLTTKK
jgi:hypothetical protein